MLSKDIQNLLFAKDYEVLAHGVTLFNQGYEEVICWFSKNKLHRLTYLGKLNDSNLHLKKYEKNITFDVSYFYKVAGCIRKVLIIH